MRKQTLIPFILSLALLGCGTEPGDDGPRLAPDLYEYQVTFSNNATTWIAIVNFRIKADRTYRRIHYGGNDDATVAKTAIISGKYRIEGDTIFFQDEKALTVAQGCESWQSAPATREFPIRNIGRREFEIYGKLDLGEVPESFQAMVAEIEPKWLEISDYRDPANWPKDITRCGMD